MADIVKPTVGATGWNTAVDAVIDRVNNFAPVGQFPRAGAYIVPRCGISVSGIPNSQLRASPIDIQADLTADRIGIEVTTAHATTVTRVGIYADDPDTGLPGALVLDAGTLDVTTTGFKEATISQLLSAGRWWLAAVNQGSSGTPVVRSNANVTLLPSFSQGELTASTVCVQRNVVGGALPAAFEATQTNSSSHRVYIRCA